MDYYFVAKTKEAGFIDQFTSEEIATRFRAGEILGNYVAAKSDGSSYDQLVELGTADWITVADLVAKQSERDTDLSPQKIVEQISATEKSTRRKGRRALIILMALALVASSSIAVLEWIHFSKHKHLFSYGLHVDVIVHDPIPDTEYTYTMYERVLTNYGVLPENISVDLMGGPDKYTQSVIATLWVQKFDSESNSWVTAQDNRGLARVGTDAYIELWPGQSVGQNGALGKNFNEGEKARFLFFRRTGRIFEGKIVIEAIESMPFYIKN